jgi:hypothetical protein
MSKWTQCKAKLNTSMRLKRFEGGGQIRSISDLLHVQVLALDRIYSAATYDMRDMLVATVKEL